MCRCAPQIRKMPRPHSSVGREAFAAPRRCQHGGYERRQSGAEYSSPICCVWPATIGWKIFVNRRACARIGRQAFWLTPQGLESVQYVGSVGKRTTNGFPAVSLRHGQACATRCEQPCREELRVIRSLAEISAGGRQPVSLIYSKVMHSLCFLRPWCVPKIQHNKIFVRFRVRGHSSVHGLATNKAGAAEGKARTMSRERFGVSHVSILSWSVEAHPHRRTFNAQHLPMRRLPADHDGRERSGERLLF
jgi:hypothetical protein